MTGGRSGSGGPIRIGLMGAGQFGASLIAQARTVPGVEMAVLCDRDVGAARRNLMADGLLEEGDVAGDAETAMALRERGRTPLVADADIALRLPFDVLVEATGAPAAAAHHALRAIDGGRHVVMVSKEAEITVGPILARRAKERGVVYTPADGDQPSLLIGLIDWATGLGLEVVAAGKSSEYDLVLEPDGDAVTIQGRRIRAPGLGALMHLAGDPRATVAARASAMGPFDRRSAPDFCEMGIVCNGARMAPDRSDLHAPILRTGELADLYKPASDGGLLERSGVIEVFHALRRQDEASFAGGVFVVVRCSHGPTWALLRDKGHVVSRCGRFAAIYRPAHLLGVEALGSVLRAARDGIPTPGYAPRPVVDLVAVAAEDMPAGTRLRPSARHGIGGALPRLQPAQPLAPGNPVPFYLLFERTLARPVAAGNAIRLDDLEAVADDAFAQLRQEQDSTFPA